MCLACQHFDFNSADWISDNLRVISSWYLRTMGKEFVFQFSRRSWGRNAWRTPKNVCGGGYTPLNFLDLTRCSIFFAELSRIHPLWWLRITRCNHNSGFRCCYTIWVRTALCVCVCSLLSLSVRRLPLLGWCSLFSGALQCSRLLVQRCEVFFPLPCVQCFLNDCGSAELLLCCRFVGKPLHIFGLNKKLQKLFPVISFFLHSF